jgi:uncharacterized protein
VNDPGSVAVAIDGDDDAQLVTADVQEGPVPYVEELSREQCIELLVGAEVGRVVFTVEALPAVIPVNYAVTDGAVVFRTAARSRLARAADRGVLAMEADQIDVATRSGWSVVVTGTAEIAGDPEEIREVARLVQPWIPGPAEVAIRLPLTVLTGRRITGAAGSA